MKRYSVFIVTYSSFLLGLSAIAAFVFGGCSTASQKQNPSLMAYDAHRESPSEVVTALGAVAGAVSGQDTNGQDLKRVAREMQSNREAQSAVTSIAGAVRQPRVIGKYCPVDGRRYDVRFTRCPEHQVELKSLEE